MEIKIFVKYLSFMEITIFVFSVESFWFLEFHEKEAKSDKRNFTRGVTVSFEVKIHKNYWKNWLHILQAYFF